MTSDQDHAETLRRIQVFGPKQVAAIERAIELLSKEWSHDAVEKHNGEVDEIKWASP